MKGCAGNFTASLMTVSRWVGPEFLERCSFASKSTVLTPRLANDVFEGKWL